MTQESTPGEKAARVAKDVAAEAGSRLLRAVLEFAVLGVLLAIAIGLLFVNPYVGLGFGFISFLVWCYKTGWVFW